MPDSTTSQHIPMKMQQEIEAADSTGRLRALGQRMPEMVWEAYDSGSSTKDIVQQISCFNDAVARRLIAILECTEGIRLPEGATFLVLGSEGRGEQTLRTDQDNAIVYRDDLPAAGIESVKRFATRVVDALDEIGVPRCRGNIMASTPQWCHSVTEWKDLTDLWINDPSPEHILNFGMFQDLRPLHGDEQCVMQLRDHICRAVQCHVCFFPNMASHVVRFPSPFTIFGSIRSEHLDIDCDLVDLKKAGIFAITSGATLLALEFGIIGGNTWSKLELLGEAGFFSAGDLATIEKAYTSLIELRLKQQLRQLAAGQEPTNSINLQKMTDDEYDRFRHALKGVDAFLWIFREHYLLDYIST
jgi:CBS domain-containing protein